MVKTVPFHLNFTRSRPIQKLAGDNLRLHCTTFLSNWHWSSELIWLKKLKFDSILVDSSEKHYNEHYNRRIYYRFGTAKINLDFYLIIIYQQITFSNHVFFAMLKNISDCILLNEKMWIIFKITIYCNTILQFYISYCFK